MGDKVIYIIGVFFILLGLLFDEGTTILLLLRGLALLETNPLLTRFGLLTHVIIVVVFYSILIWMWGWVIKTYKKFYSQKARGYKLYDVFVFFFCFMIIFLVGTKVELGYNNIQLLYKTYDVVEGSIILQHVREAKELKAEQPKEFIKIQDEVYKEGTLVKLNILQMFFYVIASFLFFRVGYKVCPYEHG